MSSIFSSTADAKARRAAGFTIVVLASIAVAVALFVLVDTERRSMIWSGDYPGFYVLPEILARGLVARLYDPELQRAIENEIWPHAFAGEFYMSVYPPFVALLLYPLTWFGPDLSRWVWNAAMCGCLLGALTFVARRVPRVRAHQRFFLALALAYVPVLHGVLGGQNTGLSMLLYAALLVANGDTARDRCMSGAIAGLWCVKPQFGLIVGFWIVCLYRTWAAAGGAVVLAGLYLAAVPLMGWGWPIEWWSSASRFGAQNFVSNNTEMVSLAVMVREGALRLGAGTGAADSAGMAVSAVGIVIFGAWCLRSGLRGRTWGPLILIGPVLTLLSPQTLYYDHGLLAVSAAAIARRRFDSDRAMLLVVAASLTVALREFVGLPFLGLWGIALLLVLVRGGYLHEFEGTPRRLEAASAAERGLK